VKETVTNHVRSEDEYRTGKVMKGLGLTLEA
jgi:hypothetical protein